LIHTHVIFNNNNDLYSSFQNSGSLLSHSILSCSRLDPLGKSVVEGGVQAIGRGTLVLQEDEVLGLVVIPAGTHWIPKLTIAMEIFFPCLHDL